MGSWISKVLEVLGLVSSSCSSSSTVLLLKCRCGQCSAPVKQQQRSKRQTTRRWDCFCSHCRLAHGAVCTSYLLVDAPLEFNAGAPIVRVQDKCASLPGSIIERLYCKNCTSRLALVCLDPSVSSSDDPSVCHVHLGNIQDTTIRADIAAQWRTNYQTKSAPEAATWYPCFPKYDESQETQPLTLHGRCGCGTYRYTIRQLDAPNEICHCYCHLCRHLSGGAFTSWIWVSWDQFEWDHKKEPPLIRTTDFGRRHICETCGTCLSIVYDTEVNEYIWPTVSSLVQAPNLDALLEEASHIYCGDKPEWYAFPDDGLPRNYDDSYSSSKRQSDTDSGTGSSSD